MPVSTFSTAFDEDDTKTVAAKKRRAATINQLLMRQGASSDPVYGVGQGLVRVAQGAMGGLLEGRDERLAAGRDAAIAKAARDAASGLTFGGGSTPLTGPTMAGPTATSVVPMTGSAVMTPAAPAGMRAVATGSGGVGGAVTPRPAAAGSVPSFVRSAAEQAAAARGVSPDYLLRTGKIESSFDPNATSSTGAQGVWQFTGGTARQYGLGNRRDVTASADAAARLASDNAGILRSRLGREPTDAELYLAHQQGAAGAAKLLANPNARAGDMVGDKAVRVNGGDPNMPAGSFAGKWINKYEKVGPLAELSADDPRLNTPASYASMNPMGDQETAGDPAMLPPSEPMRITGNPRASAPEPVLEELPEITATAPAYVPEFMPNEPAPAAIDAMSPAGFATSEFAPTDAPALSPVSGAAAMMMPPETISPGMTMTPGLGDLPLSPRPLEPSIERAPTGAVIAQGDGGPPPVVARPAPQMVPPPESIPLPPPRPRMADVVAGAPVNVANASPMARALMGDINLGAREDAGVREFNQTGGDRQALIQLLGGGASPPSPQRMAMAEATAGVPLRAQAPPPVASVQPQGAPLNIIPPGAGGGVPAGPNGPVAGPQGPRQERFDPNRYAAMRSHPAYAPLAEVYLKQFTEGQRPEVEVRELNGRLIAVDKRTQQARDVTPQGLPSGYRPFTAEERTAAGVPAGIPAFMGPDGKPQFGPAGTSVNVNTGVNKFSETLDKGAGEFVNKAFEEGGEAGDNLRTLAELRKVGSGIDTGGWAVATQKLSQLGIKLPGADKVEAYGALIDRLTPQQRVPGSGTTSDFDAKMFRGSLPALINTPQGNEIILNGMESIAKNRLARSEVAGMMMTDQLGKKEGFARLMELQREARSVSDGISAAAKQTEEARKAAGGGATTTPAQGTLKPMPADVLSEAREAIRVGKPAAAVMQKLRENGFDASGL